MENFDASQFIAFLDKIEKLKSVPRHCVTADGVQEYVAGHCWRTALMAYLTKDELGEIDIDKVIRMCLWHDIGEAVTGDIPTFQKNEAQEEIEKEAVETLLKELPQPLYQEVSALFAEMEAQETKEAKVYKALDRLEAVIQHNESDISTWLPLEYDLQQTYAEKSVEGFPFLKSLQEQAVKRTKEKIAEEENRKAVEQQEIQEKPEAGEKQLTKEQLRQQKAEEKQQKKAQKKADKAIVRQERKKECRTLFHTAELVMLIVFVVLAIDQAGVSGFLGVWLFVAIMAASIAVLILGIIRSVRKKRSGILLFAAVTGIVLCSVWFIFLIFSQGLGFGPVPN